MNHQQATKLMAVESYLLHELTPEVRDQFEEHFFDCQECAADLRATAGFMDATRKEFQLHPVPKPAAVAKGKSAVAEARAEAKRACAPNEAPGLGRARPVAWH